MVIPMPTSPGIVVVGASYWLELHFNLGTSFGSFRCICREWHAGWHMPFNLASFINKLFKGIITLASSIVKTTIPQCSYVAMPPAMAFQITTEQSKVLIHFSISNSLLQKMHHTQ